MKNLDSILHNLVYIYLSVINPMPFWFLFFLWKLMEAGDLFTRTYLYKKSKNLIHLPFYTQESFSQKLIYSGHLLKDEQQLKEILSKVKTLGKPLGHFKSSRWIAFVCWPIVLFICITLWKKVQLGKLIY